MHDISAYSACSLHHSAWNDRIRTVARSNWKFKIQANGSYIPLFQSLYTSDES